MVAKIIEVVNSRRQWTSSNYTLPLAGYFPVPIAFH